VGVPGFRGWVVGAEVTGAAWQPDPDEPLSVFSVHAPSGRGSYAKVVNALLDKIRRLAKGRELVLGGDFNLTVGIGCQTGRPVRKASLAIQARLADEFGLVNCWQVMNPGRPLPQTLRWTSNPTVPYHCDGIFVPKAWASRLIACDVLAGGDWDRLSDHNPVIAPLGEHGPVKKTRARSASEGGLPVGRESPPSLALRARAGVDETCSQFWNCAVTLGRGGRAP
jgi:hypothetical protein